MSTSPSNFPLGAVQRRPAHAVDTVINNIDNHRRPPFVFPDTIRFFPGLVRTFDLHSRDVPPPSRVYQR